jgi:hypothetical protein
MSNEQQLEIIKQFDPVTATHYFTDIGTVCFFGVILRDGIIDIEKYRSGRMYTQNLQDNEHFICFKKITTKENKVQLYLREKLDITKLNPKDLDLYLYIENMCSYNK